MTNAQRHRAVARVTIELTTPLHVGSGEADLLEDQPVVRDANGLPTIPGTSLAGVLRNAWRDDDEEEWFGPRRKKGERSEKEKEGRRSRVFVSFAHVHDSGNRPVAALADPEAVGSDPALGPLLESAVRQRVRINHRGVVDERGKFDQTGVPVGARFTFEVELRHEVPVDDALERLLALLASSGLRLGGSTRSGYGRFRVIRAETRTFDLKKDLEAYLDLPAELSTRPPGFADRTPSETAAAERVRCTVDLRAVEPWRIGGETEGPGGDGPDMVPTEESILVWKDDSARWEQRILVPATALKGPLRHRTAFHARVQAGSWTRQVAALENPAEKAEAHSVQAVRRLFGYAEGDEDGAPGRVLLDDHHIDEPAHRMEFQHVSLDRFSGAPILGRLFRGQTLPPGTTLRFEVVVLDGGDDHLEETDRHALNRALDDLCQGRLQIGAGYGRGLGWFEGERTPWSGERATLWNEGAAR